MTAEKMEMTLQTGKKGFTLIEVTVVTAIFLIIIYFILPNFIKYSNDIGKTEKIEELKNNFDSLKKIALYENIDIKLIIEKTRLNNYENIQFVAVNNELISINSSYLDSIIEISKNGEVTSGKISFEYKEYKFEVEILKNGEVNEIN